MFTTLIGWACAAIMLLGCAFVLVAGDKLERIGAAVYLLCWLLSTIIRVVLGTKLLGVVLVLGLDLLLLATFTALIWKAPRNWPVWAAALQLLIATTQGLYLTDFSPTVSAYFTVVNIASMGIIGVLVYGSVVAWQERQFSTNAVNDLGRYS